MSAVEQIEMAITRLTRDEEAEIRSWLNERAESEWDRRIESDIRAGRLNPLAEQALVEHRAGRTKPL